MRYIVLAFVVALALSATAIATNGGSGEDSPIPPPTDVGTFERLTAQYDAPTGDLELTLAASKPMNVFVIAGQRIPDQRFNGGCDGLQADVNVPRGDAWVYAASDPNANNRLTFPVEQDGNTATVVIPNPPGELPPQPACLFVVLNPYGEEFEDGQGLPTVSFDQTGKAVVTP